MCIWYIGSIGVSGDNLCLSQVEEAGTKSQDGPQKMDTIIQGS